jgi:hypothetical protein
MKKTILMQNLEKKKNCYFLPAHPEPQLTPIAQPPQPIIPVIPVEQWSAVLPQL